MSLRDFIVFEEGTLRLLLSANFWNSQECNEEVQEPPTHFVSQEVWRFTSKVVTPGKLKWTKNSFVPFKSAGMDDIFLGLLQTELESPTNPLLHLFSTCFALGYISTSWREVRTVFISKPVRNIYVENKCFAPISLTPFFVKVMEILI